jgi:prevent-host-death family protein
MSMLVTSTEAKAQLQDLLRQVAQGQEVVITQNGKAIARLVSAEQPRAEEEAEERPWRGLFVPEPPPDPQRVPAFLRPLPVEDIPREEPALNLNWLRAVSDDDE